MVALNKQEPQKINNNSKLKKDPNTWLGGLIKNFALIQLVEAQKNLDEMQKIQKERQD